MKGRIMSDYIETVSNMYNMQSNDITSTISALLILAFVIYLVVDSTKKK